MIPMNEKRYIIDKDKIQILMIMSVKEAEQPAITDNEAYKIVTGDVITKDFASVAPVCTHGHNEGPKSQPRLEWDVNITHGRYDYYDSVDEAMNAYISLKMNDGETLLRQYEAGQKHIKKAWMTLQAGK